MIHAHGSYVGADGNRSVSAATTTLPTTMATGSEMRAGTRSGGVRDDSSTPDRLRRRRAYYVVWHSRGSVIVSPSANVAVERTHSSKGSMGMPSHSFEAH